MLKAADAVIIPTWSRNDQGGQPGGQPVTYDILQWNAAQRRRKDFKLLNDTSRSSRWVGSKIGGASSAPPVP
jgi:hypothetical protein